MKKAGLVLFVAVLAAALSLDAHGEKPGDKEMDRFIDSLMRKMTIEEKVGQTNLLTWDGSLKTGETQSRGVTEKIARGAVGGLFNVKTLEDRIRIQEYNLETSRLGIPLMFGLDVVHGHRTTFPIPLALSCSWDMALIERTAAAAADEASSDGVDWVYSPMVDIVRDPRWGRVAESGGEDPFLGSRIAEAMVRGYQGDSVKDPDAVMACVKHFALYGAGEGGRDYDMADMSLFRMYNEYLPPYKAAVDAGVGSVMTSFNDINGLPATANKWLLTTLLRDQWGFDGFTVSDYTSVAELSAHGLGTLAEVSSRALAAGLDMDMVSEGVCGNLEECLRRRLVSEAEIDRACRRVLEAKYRLGLFDDPFLRLHRGLVEKEKYSGLALESARKSMVLLKNSGDVLPLRKDSKILLVGPLADARFDLKGTWAGRGLQDIGVVSVKEGIERYVPGLEYTLGAVVTENPDLARMIEYRLDRYPDNDTLIAEALKAAEDADVIVAVLGETAKMSGESASMTDIGLQKPQRQLLEALVGTGKDVVLVLVNGRPMTLEWENGHCAAILEAWAPGVRGGDAVADILFGEYNPSGRLSITFPRNVGQIPVYYSMKSTGRPYIPFRKYRTGYIDCVSEPLYPFGYGLSYSDVEYSSFSLSREGNRIVASVVVSNRSDRHVDETVQLYVGDPVASATRPVKELKGFVKVSLLPGESRKVVFDLTDDDLSFWNTELERVFEPGEFILGIGHDSSSLLSGRISL